MLRFALLLTALVAAGVAPAATGPFTLPPRAKVTATEKNKGWQASGTLGLSFAQAQARFATAISAAGWTHLHSIGLGKDRTLEAWSRGGEELTVMIWRLAPGRSGFSYGLSKKAKSRKGGR